MVFKQTKSDFQMWIHFCTGKKLSRLCIHFQINFLFSSIQFICVPCYIVKYMPKISGYIFFKSLFSQSSFVGYCTRCPIHFILFLYRVTYENCIMIQSEFFKFENTQSMFCFKKNNVNWTCNILHQVYAKISDFRANNIIRCISILIYIN